eukprot:TRINITY_DN1401_c1_g1_i1.p1 TRINITY_DN1401_c1_g1~~TRINITY_DN1401_c1_g1_i1.p1  ORF type:complete len:657 (+),score=285.89 TRINITY_DN1401_c1_g1_i1:87-2057(+)
MDEWQKKLALLKKQREETRATPGATTTTAGAGASTAPKPASPFASAASRTAPASSVASASSTVRTPATSGYTPSSATTASRAAPSVPSTAASSSPVATPSSPSTSSWRGNTTTASSSASSAASSSSTASPSIPTTPASSTVTRTSLVGAPAVSKPLPQAPSVSSPSTASNGTAPPAASASGTASPSIAGSSSGSYRMRAGSKPTPVIPPSSPSSVSPSSSGGSPLPSSPSTASAASAALASIPISSSGGIGSVSSPSASAGGGPASAERELSMLKTEHKMLTMKYESEIRKREGVERQLAQATQELEQLKAKRSGAGAQAMVEKTKADMERTNRKRMMELKSQRLKSQADHLSADNRASVVLSPLAKTSAGADAATAADRRQSRLMARKSRAPSSAGAAGGAPKTNIVDIITRVLDEMMRLEGNMKKAEDGRMKAEGELLEVAMYKQASDEALQTVAADVNAQMVLLEQAISSLESFTRDNPSFTGPLNIIRDKFRNVKRAIEQRLDDNRLAGEKPTAEVVNKRASVYAAKLQLPPPPPPLEGLGSASSSSGSTYISPATRASRRGPAAALAEEKGSRTSTLLDQIRKGKNLTKIDVEAMKRDREQQLKNNRKSMALLSSLQDTLRMALSARSSEMNLYSEDDVEDWEEGDDWEDE